MFAAEADIGWVGLRVRRPSLTMEAVSRPPQRAADGPRDSDLTDRLRAGDRSAVDDAYDRFRRPAFALARRIVVDDALAEDVLQEVFLGVWRDPAAFDGGGSVSARLLAAVHRRALDAVPWQQREALTLAFYDGHTQLEIAALTGVPVATVRGRMLAGVRRLQEELRRPGR